MTEYEASRTLVKSPPELWAELSDQVSLTGHLAEPFGEIRITRLEPETAVAWEGERASGTVRIEPSGWGTRVTLTARAVEVAPPGAEQLPDPGPPAPEPLPPPVPAPEPLPPAAHSPSPPAVPKAPPRGLRARLFGWLGAKPALAHEPAPVAASAPAPAAPPAPVAPPPPAPAATAPPKPPPAPATDPEAVLVGVLDKLGAAHHRPFSRA